MSIGQSVVGPQTSGNASAVTPRASKFASTVTAETNGKHFEETLNGNLFTYTIAGQALVLAATTGGHPTVINPAGSGVIFVPVALRISFVSGTTVIGSVVLATTLNAVVGTGATIPTATLVAAKSAMRGSAFAPRCAWSPTTNTFTAAPTVDFATGINLGAAAPTGTGTYEAKFDGAVAYYPGTAMSVCYTVTTSTALFTTTILGIEVPLPPGS